MAVTKKKSTKKRGKSSVGPDQMRSFRLYSSDEPFLVLRISHQTFYWLLVSLMVLALGVWVVLMTTRVHAIYNQVDVISIKEL